MGGMAGTGTGVHRDSRRQLHQIEASQQIAAHLRMQDGGGIVGPCGAIERAPHPTDVERVGRKAIRRGLIRHVQPVADGLSKVDPNLDPVAAPVAARPAGKASVMSSPSRWGPAAA